jgi:hypothetical protein
MDRDTKSPVVGSAVRVTSEVSVAARPGSKNALRCMTVARRSIVATPPDENGFISLVQDDLAPEPKAGRERRFLIAPLFNSVGVEVQDCEVTASDVMPLLEFERCDHPRGDSGGDDASALARQFKDYGDQLFRINDFTCAITHYEAALHLVSSKFDDIGGTLVVRRGGHSVIAEVDCIEKDERNTFRYDVTFDSGEDATISQKEVIIAVWADDTSCMQVKILLNMSRCLLKLADIDTTRGNASRVGEKRSSSSSLKSRQERYRLAAVLGCSVAITLCDHCEVEDLVQDSAVEVQSLAEKARIIRARACLGLGKMPNAISDVKKVLSQSPSSREADALLSEIKAVEDYNKSVDKKLSKEVCKWVQTATSSSNGADAMERMSGSVSEDESDVSSGDHEVKKPAEKSTWWRMLMSCFLELSGTVGFLIAMWFLYTPNTQSIA